MDSDLCREVENAIGVFFHDKTLLVDAVTSKSYAKEAMEKDPSIAMLDNERLEFLGDSVLELVIRDYLFTHSSESEAILSSLADELVNDEYLYQVAVKMGLKKYVRLGVGEANNVEKNQLVGALEAIIGAIYLDAGLSRAINFILEQIILSK